MNCAEKLLETTIFLSTQKAQPCELYHSSLKVQCHKEELPSPGTLSYINSAKNQENYCQTYLQPSAKRVRLPHVYHVIVRLD